MAKQTGSALEYFHKDHLGSTNAISRDDGTIIEQGGYLPFGLDGTGNTLLQASSYKFTDQEQDDGTGLYNYDARLYDPVICQFIMADTIVPDPANPQTLNRYSYCGNNPLIYTDPSGHLFGLDDIFIGAIVGAILGGAVSGVTGGNFWDGALSGTISGAIFGGIHNIPGMTNLNGVVAGGGEALSSVTQAGIHFVGGAVSGGINAVISDTDIGMGMLIGGVSAGVGKYVGMEYLQKANWGTQFATRTLIGGATGGIAAELNGGEFFDGFKGGARFAAIAFICNDSIKRFTQSDPYAGGKPLYEEYVVRTDGKLEALMYKMAYFVAGARFLPIRVGMPNLRFSYTERHYMFQQLKVFIDHYVAEYDAETGAKISGPTKYWTENTGRTQTVIAKHKIVNKEL